MPKELESGSRETKAMELMMAHASSYRLLLNSALTCTAVGPEIKEGIFLTENMPAIGDSLSDLFGKDLSPQLIENIIQPLRDEGHAHINMLVRSGQVLKGVSVFSVKGKIISREDEEHILLEVFPQDEAYTQIQTELTQKNFTNLLDHLQDGVMWLCTETFNVKYANPSALSILGYTIEEIVDTHISSHYPTEGAEEFEAFLRDYNMKLEEGPAGNFWFKNREGKEIPVNLSRNIIEVYGNEAQQLIFKDNSDRADVSQKLKEGEIELLKTQQDLLEAQRLGNIGSGVLDIVNGKVNFTDHAKQIWGLAAKDEIKLKDLFRQIHPSDIKTVKKIYKRVISARSEETMTIRIKMPNGEDKYLSCNLKPLLTDNFQVHRIFGTSQDITVLKQAETEVRKALEKETQLNELRSHFVAIVSHQYRTPLTIIRSSADLIPMIVGDIGWEKLEDINRYVKKITHEVERMNSLLDEVLSYESIERGGISFSPRPTDCIGWIRRLVSKYHDFLGDGRGIQLQIMSPACSVMMDAKLLEHALGNIMSNALKYSVGNKEPELEVWNEGYNVYFSIRDYGIGIPEKDMQNLFHPFFRASNTKNMDGTGMGLAISRQLIELHLGSISISNADDKGTQVLISIPSGFPS
ncbi:MAG: ATP-binding protein [Bacteroidota bacterium]